MLLKAPANTEQHLVIYKWEWRKFLRCLENCDNISIFILWCWCEIKWAGGDEKQSEGIKFYSYLDVTFLPYGLQGNVFIFFAMIKGFEHSQYNSSESNKFKSKESFPLCKEVKLNPLNIIRQHSDVFHNF